MKYNDREEIMQLTPKWTGERLPDGRPKVPDDILDRYKNIILEEAWDILGTQLGYHNTCVEVGFKRTTESIPVLVGRALTAAFIPTRPDLNEITSQIAQKSGYRFAGNQLVVNSLGPRDVAVIDIYDKVFQGTIFGGNIAKALQVNTQNGGAVIWGGIRDEEQISRIPNLQIYHRGEDSDFIHDATLASVNSAVRIGRAVCLPGDVVFAGPSGVMFIPPHLAETVLIGGEKSHVRDDFGFQRLDEGKYRVNQVHARWTMDIWDDFLEWFKVDEKAAPYQHLDWTEDYEKTRKLWEEDPNITRPGI